MRMKKSQTAPIDLFLQQEEKKVARLPMFFYHLEAVKAGRRVHLIPNAYYRTSTFAVFSFYKQISPLS